MRNILLPGQRCIAESLFPGGSVFSWCPPQTFIRYQTCHVAVLFEKLQHIVETFFDSGIEPVNERVYACVRRRQIDNARELPVGDCLHIFVDRSDHGDVTLWRGLKSPVEQVEKNFSRLLVIPREAFRFAVMYEVRVQYAIEICEYWPWTCVLSWHSTWKKSYIQQLLDRKLVACASKESAWFVVPN